MIEADAALGDLLRRAMEQLQLSARAYDRILKGARAFADLVGAERIPYRIQDLQAPLSCGCVGCR